MPSIKIQRTDRKLLLLLIGIKLLKLTERL